MKSVKKYSAIFLAATLVLSCTACGTTNETKSSVVSGSSTVSNSVGVANPIHSTTESKLSEQAGISLSAPEGATNVSYTYIEAVGESNAIAQVEFELNGNDYCYRAQATDLTSLFGGESSDATDEASDVLDIGQTLSGMYDEFQNGARTSVTYCDAFCAWTDNEGGFVIWLDPVPGLLYCLSTSEGASEDGLVSTAKTIFLSAQGDSDGGSSTEDSTDISTFAGTYTRQQDSSTVTINADGTVNVSIERLTSMDGSVTSVDQEFATLTVKDANGENMGLIFGIDSHELTVTDSHWDLLENGTSFQFD